MPGTVIRLVSLFSTINISKGHDIQSSEEPTLGQVNAHHSGGNRRHVGPQQQQGPQRPQQWHSHGRSHGRERRPYHQHQGGQRRQQAPPQGNQRSRRRRTSQAAGVQANRRVPTHVNQHAQPPAAPVNHHHTSVDQPPSYSQAMGGFSLWDLLRSECSDGNNGECRIDPFNLAGIFPLQNLSGFQNQQNGPEVHQEGQCCHGEVGRQGLQQGSREPGGGDEAVVQPGRVQDRLGQRRQDSQQVGGQDISAGAVSGETGEAAQRTGQERQQVASQPRRGGPSRRRRRERRARLRAAASSTTSSSTSGWTPTRTPRGRSPRPDSVEQRGPQDSVLELDESLLRDLEELFPERGGGGTDAETPEERERGILTLTRSEADGAAESRTRRDEGWR